MIGKSKFNILDETFKVKEAAQKPGPGSYKKFSDFNNTLDGTLIIRIILASIIVFLTFGPLDIQFLRSQYLKPIFKFYRRHIIQLPESILSLSIILGLYS